MRSAFTLVEMLVAIAVLSVGVLALAATAGLVAAHAGDGARLTDAAHAARSVTDSLATRPCSTIVSGASRNDGRTIQWTARRDSLGVQVDVSVRAALRRSTQQLGYRALIPCPGE
jgi:prepilin-type N-terminal cleavage/methylation domain-containing protein